MDDGRRTTLNLWTTRSEWLNPSARKRTHGRVPDYRRTRPSGPAPGRLPSIGPRTSLPRAGVSSTPVHVGQPFTSSWRPVVTIGFAVRIEPRRLETYMPVRGAARWQRTYGSRSSQATPAYVSRPTSEATGQAREHGQASAETSGPCPRWLTCKACARRSLQTYGHDVTRWAGYEVLRDIREFHMTCMAAQVAAENPARHEVPLRLACLRGEHGSRPWTWTAMP